MYLEQDYKFHFLSFLGRGGFKIGNSKKKTIRALRTPPPSVAYRVKTTDIFLSNMKLIGRVP